jgi:alpha-beta hydrolase superfamily lysophospholipase
MLASLGASLPLGGCALPRDILYSPGEDPPAAIAWVNGAPQPLTVETADNLSLAGYYWPGAPGDRDIYIFFHGRNWTAERAANAAQHLVGAGNAVLVASYRGFGANPDHPSEQGLLRDAAAFIANARELAGAGARVWLIGHSIGSAVALHAAAADGHVAGVIAMSAFVTITAATPRFWRAFVPDRWDNLTALKALHVPVLFIQGGLDRLIPATSGDALFSAYDGPGSLVMGEASRHNPDMHLLAPWINQALAAMRDGSLATLPAPPAGWIEKVRRP